MRCERRNSSSGSVKTIATHRIAAAAAAPLVDCKTRMATTSARRVDMIGGYTNVRPQGLDRPGGSFIEMGPQHPGARPNPIEGQQQNKPFPAPISTRPQDSTSGAQNLGPAG